MGGVIKYGYVGGNCRTYEKSLNLCPLGSILIWVHLVCLDSIRNGNSPPFQFNLDGIADFESVLLEILPLHSNIRMWRIQFVVVTSVGDSPKSGSFPGVSYFVDIQCYHSNHLVL